MKLCDLRRTAPFKYEGRSILLLKLSLPRAIAETDNEIQLVERFNAIYLSLAEEYSRSAERYAELCGARLAGAPLPRPLTVRVTWEEIYPKKSRTAKKEKKESAPLAYTSEIYIKRTLILPRVDKTEEKTEAFDRVDPLLGILLA